MTPLDKRSYEAGLSDGAGEALIQVTRRLENERISLINKRARLRCSNAHPWALGEVEGRLKALDFAAEVVREL